MGAHKINPFARGNIVGGLPTVVCDRLGRPLSIGDLVVFPLDLQAFQLKEVNPILDPNAPPNLVQATFVCVMPITMKSGSAAPVLRVATAAEQGVGVANNGSDPVGDAPPPVVEN